MERNWLIRTTQKQILGPVAKSKVLEFLDKGALGLNDEVSSGNGYWFSLKEKDLVEKYLLGDVPQTYNPISESISVLSKRENPDKTTSLNATPINKTQVLKVGAMLAGILPNESDLEFPDITIVNTSASTLLYAPNSELKMPTTDDLEFPDISMIKKSINDSPNIMQNHTEVKIKTVEKVEIIGPATEAIIYPEASDLDYPDMFGKQSEAPEVERDFKVDVKKAEMIHSKIESKKTVSREFHNEFENDSGLSLDLNTALKGEVVEKAETAFSLKKSKVKESSSQNVEEKKLLHERKIKISHQSPALNEIASRQPEDAPRTALPEHLKKRNDNYLMYVLVILVLIIFSLFFYYYRTILNKPLPV